MSSEQPVVPPASRRPLLKKLIRIAAIAGLVVGVAIQFVPVRGIGVNPPARFTPDAPPEVLTLLKDACYDCHSNETKWPLYARIAPGSWLMAQDVNKGRSRMNISEWGEASEEERALDKETAWEQIEAGEMPKWFYIPMHWSAHLNDAEKATLRAWLMPPKK